MSFAQQEQALFDLLFDDKKLAKFENNSNEGLAEYDLTTEEKHDFQSIRIDALKLDASARKSMLMPFFCKYYPLSFSLLSSQNDFKTLLKSLIDSEIAAAAPHKKTLLFGQKLLRHINQPSSLKEQPLLRKLLTAILDAEIAMADSAFQLKESIMQKRYEQPTPPAFDRGWDNNALSLGTFVRCHILPQPYSALKKQLCPVDPSVLWPRIQSFPLPESLLQPLLEEHNPMLFIARPRIDEASDCDPLLDHFTVEIAEGFAPILSQLDGSLSTNELLAHLRASGADDELLLSIKRSLYQLLDIGILTFH